MRVARNDRRPGLRPHFHVRIHRLVDCVLIGWIDQSAIGRRVFNVRQNDIQFRQRPFEAFGQFAV